MNYRTIADMAQTIRSQLYRIPSDIDLVVGVPRSGMLAATMISLYTNTKLANVGELVSNAILNNGMIRLARHQTLARAQQARHVLLVDDSTSTGQAINSALQRVQISGYGGKITTCAIYAEVERCPQVDFYFEVVPQTRIFEWNLMHRDFLEQCCVDLDGVLCVDPTDEQNDDGEEYSEFLRSAPPLHAPTYKIGRIVTSRLEKYRQKTSEWLDMHNIKYGALDMLDLPDAATRRRLGIYARFKASIYSRESEMKLFIESERSQAIEISQLTGKHAICISTQEMFAPGLTIPYARQALRRWTEKGLRKLRRPA